VLRSADRDTQHEELLALAHRAQRAAIARDRSGLVTETNRLLTALAMHLDDEMNRHVLSDDASHEAEARSLQRLVEQFVTLARAAAIGSDAEPSLEGLANEALLQLYRQIDAEASA